MDSEDKEYWTKTWTIRIRRPRTILQKCKENLHFIIPLIILGLYGIIAHNEPFGYIIGIAGSFIAIMMYLMFKPKEKTNV